MSRQEPTLTENQAIGRTLSLILFMTLWGGVCASAAWHFSSEHTQLQMLTQQQASDAMTLSELSPGKVIVNAARSR